MLGFTLEECELLYDQTSRFYPSPVLTFQQFANILEKVNVDAVRLAEGESGDYDLGEYVSELFRDPEFAMGNPSLPAFTREDGAFSKYQSVSYIAAACSKSGQRG